MTPGLRRWGPPDAPRVLLLHCSLAHAGAWDGVARTLSSAYQLVAPDLVGHGRGPEGDPVRDYHDQATDQARALLGEGPVHIVGHSFGGTVALRLAEEAPDQVASLTLYEPVLFAAAPASPAKAANAEALAEVRALTTRGELREAARRFLSTWGNGTDFDALPRAQAAYMADRMWIIAAQRSSLHEDSAELLPRLGSVACPVLLMRGSTSPPVIADILEALAADLLEAQRTVIHDAGHMGPITHSGLVADEIAAFLGRAT